ncbi:microcystin-dependent protein [Chitinophaga polysaccharea]|uniref:Microcystin-dependent protein n=1 Tax=Chitinophaga polysaccharea TaxID=1293035 RepID=A0A561PP36_9BACT|nr:tail fiber protein [Chitinophaga polysaccharea]TWF39863.1 microcystin-dependent protein [Chitinophaga polysaccharea]
MAFVGEIRMFAGTFAPAGWAICDGSLIPISENDTLFNLIGTTYGGDGQETFALPNLQGRVPMHMGGSHVIGQASGSEEVTLIADNLPPHAHLLKASVAIPAYGENPGTALSPAYPAITAGNMVYSTVQGTGPNAGYLNPINVAENSADSNGNYMMQVQPTGGNQPKYNMQPYLAVNFIISLYGIYPSQT